MSENLFAKRIRELRIAHNVSQKILGEAIGLSTQTVNDIEKGRSNFTLERAILVAQYFNISLDYLVGISEDPKISTSTGIDPMLLLPADEQALLIKYRSLDPILKGRLQERADVFSEKPSDFLNPTLDI